MKIVFLMFQAIPKLTLSNLNLTDAKGVNGGAIYNEGTLILTIVVL